MNIVFMGSPSFALPALDRLAASPDHVISAIYTRPDAHAGRGNKMQPTRVKMRAEELGLPVFTPYSLRESGVVEHLASLAPDVIIVAAFGALLTREVLDIPRFGCLNIHGSLLPRWRGAAPVQRAILNGDELAGVCLMQMEEGLDTGAYHTLGAVEIAHKTTEELLHELAEIGADGLLEALPQIEAGTYEWFDQDAELVTYAEKVSKDETLLRPGLTNAEFLRRVQASSHRTPSRCVICGRRVTILLAHPADIILERGEVVLEKKHIYLGLKGRAVEIDEVKPENKRVMSAQAWIAGLHGSDDLTWSVLPEYYHKLPVYG